MESAKNKKAADAPLLRAPATRSSKRLAAQVNEGDDATSFSPSRCAIGSHTPSRSGGGIKPLTVTLKSQKTTTSRRRSSLAINSLTRLPSTTMDGLPQISRSRDSRIAHVRVPDYFLTIDIIPAEFVPQMEPAASALTATQLATFREAVFHLIHDQKHTFVFGKDDEVSVKWIRCHDKSSAPAVFSCHTRYSPISVKCATHNLLRTVTRQVERSTGLRSSLFTMGFMMNKTLDCGSEGSSSHYGVTTI